jgi:hypothetical protein
MSEHGWPDLHNDHGDHADHGDGHDDAGLHHDDALVPDDIHDVHDAGEHDTDDGSPWHDEPAEVHDDTPYEHHAASPVDAEDEPWTPPEHDMGLVGADPDALPDAGPDPVDMFPQVVDVGPLPEPVDGFPWIDTGSLGVVDAHAIGTVDTHDAEVTPQELAEYAGADLPPGADPWAALADSEDPATSTLARWWSEHQQ